ncbi:COX15/CtaA family protein [Pseudomonas sp. 21LCFQ010]|uniref:COX15/CtaA family protein n=1 Tax=Pseudomonas sp. 21LCFQ010 TaxID=2957506 RepID=UPI0020970D51|nr:COX15/CtaA family protein [Pseudomonas sp. 21LCFQ010]MCO8162426.1 COX15/CtaA family protein [Pseudomonas sp. 21LCFQ010]
MADRGFHLALFATLLALLVLLLGAWTRLTHAGLGCPDWPGCYGFATVPSGALQQALAQSRFPQTVLEADKGWYEMIHRYGAALLGLSIGLLMLQAWARGQGLRLPLLLLGLVIAQALLGMWTVTLRLWPPVVTLHLLGAVAILGLLLVLTLRLSGVAAPVIRSSVLLRGLALLALMLAVLQIGLGGWVSTHYAAHACPDLPTCQGQWWPPNDFAAGFDLSLPVGPNYLGGMLDGEARTAIHLAHRLGALLLSLAVLGLAWRLVRTGLSGLGAVLLLLLLAQLGLGMGNVLLQFPVWLALAHSAGGALLMLWLTLVNYRLWQAAGD